MKSRLLLIFISAFIGLYVNGQTFVPIENSSFDIPDNGQKISNGEVPGWAMDTVKDSGRESWYGGYTTNEDGSMYQAVDVIEDTVVTYILSYGAQVSWTPEQNDTSYIVTYFSAFSGDDPTTRVVLDSMVTLVRRAEMNNWTEYAHAFEIQAGSEHAGDSLVIEINMFTEQDYPSWIQFDDFSLIKFYEGVSVFEIANVIDSVNLTGPEDFTAYVAMGWDTDSIYFMFNITDDSVVNSPGNPWEVDNIEIYLDLDNSKNVSYPRNHGWINNDPTFDTNDYQIRLVPDVGFETNNSPRPAGQSVGAGAVVQQYEKTDTGYNFYLSIAWDSLLADFDPTIGTMIGADVLVSDNDLVPASTRAQISGNSPTDKIFNDPSLWATMVLAPYGQFLVIPDTIAPSAPENVTATADSVSVTLEWDPSEDNIAVLGYAIYQDEELVDMMTGDSVNNMYVVEDLEPGTYSFIIVAFDNYGNVSDTSESVEATVTSDTSTVSIGSQEITLGKVYPNPSAGIFNIEGIGTDQIFFEVYNLAGKKVLSGEFYNRYSLDLKPFAKGVYFMHMNSGNKTQIVKLVVQ